jgi:phenylalanyl-tRNA synthetase alpha chain
MIAHFEDIMTASDLKNLTNEAMDSLKSVSSDDEAEQWRVTWIGRNGKLTEILRGIGRIPKNERRTIGMLANQTKSLLEESLNSQLESIKISQQNNNSSKTPFDVTLPGRNLPSGGLHPVSKMVRMISRIFNNMGFEIAEGPEIELDKYNFEMLNIPQGHPARDMWNTLWIDYINEEGNYPMLLRTHTSPMQARYMENSNPPVRVLVPGKCYRYEATDATHEWHFQQIEGLVVDKGITFAHLKGTLYEFARLVFGEDRQIRFRCDYFPFVEPGVDMSIDCFICDGRGCRVCSDTGWIEIMGAGMVHPNVLEGVGCDPNVYSGFAFGMGPERIAMLKYGIDDIRHFYSNDLRFLKQFN